MPRIVIVGPEAGDIAAVWHSAMPSHIEVICTDDRGVAYYRALNDTLFVLADELSAPLLHKTFISSIGMASDVELPQASMSWVPIFGYRGGKVAQGGEREPPVSAQLESHRWLALEALLSGACSFEIVWARSCEPREPLLDASRSNITTQRLDQLIACVRDVSLDVLTFSGEELECLVVALFEPFLDIWGWQKRQLEAFVATVHSLYRDAPYHSWFHAVDVVQMMSLFLDIPALNYLFSPLERATAMLAGLLHDVDHDGITNKGHMAISSDRHKFAAKATQEQHHLAIARRLLSQAQLDHILLHSLITKLIDATDMAQHTTYCKQFKDALTSNDLSSPRADYTITEATSGDTIPTTELPPLMKANPITTQWSKLTDSEDTRYLLLITIMKAADLSNTVRHPDTSRKWGQLLGNEFSQAYLREQSAHIPAASQSFHGDPLPAHNKIQLSFFKNIILPFYSLIAECQILKDFAAPFIAHAQLGIQHFDTLTAADTSSSTPTHDNEV